MKADYFLSAGQYLAYLAVGYLYFMGIANVFGAAAGVGPLGLILLFLPLFLAGLASGLSFFRPRIAALLATMLVLPFLATGIYSMIESLPGSESLFWIIPAFVVILISVPSLIWSKDSLWSTSSRVIRTILALLAAVPAMAALFFLVSIVLWLASGYNIR
jgi:hypothetical protein